jgi:lysozyme
MTEAIALAAQICRRFEGLRLKPYICPAGVPTIGYGATRYPTGKPVTLADAAITKHQAEELLAHDLSGFYVATVKLCPVLVAEPASRAAAITSFCFNLGAGRLKASTLRRRVNDKQWADAAAELMKWTRGGGKVLPGLVARRQAEADMLLGRYGSHPS